MAKNVVMKDVADAVGVSVVSVSKAISGKEGLSEEMRRKILRTAREMGYIPDVQSNDDFNDNITIGILVADRFFEDNSFYTDMYRRLLLKCSRNGYTCILEIITKSAENSLVLANLISDKKVDGVIMMGQFSAKYVQLITKQSLPYMLLDFYDELHFRDSVVSDGTFGTFKLTTDLIKNGCKKLKFVGNIFATGSIMDRYLGFCKAILCAGYSISDDMIINDRDLDSTPIEILIPEELPDAFVCNCDFTAYNLIKTLKAKGIEVPNDVSVVGFDNSQYATLGDLSIQTFEVNISDMTDSVIKQIVKKIRKEDYISERIVTSVRCVTWNSVKYIF